MVNQSLSEAFNDLQALMNNAKALVDIAHNFQKTIIEKQAQEESEFDKMMLNMGIASPVTKSSAGNLFHMELARQLYEFLQRPIKETGGMVTLTDVYCLYNRARGTDLISPEDLYKACSMFDSLKLPLHLRKFESGVLAIQSS
eukprot:TRINITY_DN7361_c0_g2_i1.p1 TRINITY_DN7361_c0_g2~~TRINITY_DN7361_c0_g2_i1.p1  ORF type:complete len:143 (+),score=14.16 TRINITY_DN7361_c0_g2_i1:94-522(+)